MFLLVFAPRRTETCLRHAYDVNSGRHWIAETTPYRRWDQVWEARPDGSQCARSRLERGMEAASWKKGIPQHEGVTERGCPRGSVSQLIERLPVPCWCASTISLKGKGRRPKKVTEGREGNGRKPPPLQYATTHPIEHPQGGLLSIQKVFRAPTERSTHGGAI